MSPHLILLAVLLAALALLLRRKKQQTQASPAARRASPSPISRHPGIETVEVPIPNEPAYRSFSAHEWRTSVKFSVHREGELLALKLSRLFEKERPGDFNDEDWALQATLLEITNKRQLAIAKYTALLAQPVPDMSAYNNRGYALMLLGKYKQAIPDFDQAIAVGSTEAYAYNNRGFAYLRLGQASKALGDIKQSLQLDSSNSYAHRNLGIYYYEQHQMESALAALEDAMRQNAETPHLKMYLRWVQQALSERNVH